MEDPPEQKTPETGPLTLEIQALVDYYARQGYWNHVQQECAYYLQNNNDMRVRFWRGMALSESGNQTEAIRELEPLQDKPELALAVCAALMNAHKNARVRDKDALAALKDKLKTLSKTSNDAALIFSARYFWHAGKPKQAKQCVEKVLGKNKRCIEALVIEGWISLTSGPGRGERKGLQYFEMAIKLCEQKKDIAALMGRAKFNEKRNRFDKALEDINLVIAQYPSFVPAVAEKARVLVMVNNWDEAMTTAMRLLKRDPLDLDALRLFTLYLLAREPKSGAAENRISELMDAIDRTESRNHRLYYEVAQLVARLANRKPQIVQLSLAMVERALKLDPNDSLYLAEHAYQLTLVGDLNRALMEYNEASKIGEGNLQAMTGRIKCKILLGNFTEAEQELDLVKEMGQTVAANSELMYLSSLLAWQRDGQEEKAVAMLDEAIDVHLNAAKEIDPGYARYIAFNPDFMLEVVREYMSHIGTEPLSATDPPNPLLNKAIQLLQTLTELVPALLGAQLLLAKAAFLAGDYEEADRAIIMCTRIDLQSAEAHIISAQMYMARENYKGVAQALDQARALNFEIRNTPVVHLLRAKLADSNGQTDEALKLLEQAMQLPGVRRVNPKAAVSLQDRISIFLELAALQAKTGHLSEATKIMQDARNEFQKTSEIFRVTLADAELAVRRRDFEAALAMLKSLPGDSPYYTRAKVKMAEIYLKHKKNKRGYAAMYLEMAERGRNVHSYILLGEAYMRIQEPEKAIQAFEDALRLNPDDPTLSSRLGRALVTTHDYRRAIEYYETAARGDPTKTYLLHELADLYLQLKEFFNAIKLLTGALNHPEHKSEEDPRVMILDVKTHMLLAQVYKAAWKMGVEDYGNPADAVRDALQAALNLQAQVLDKFRSTNPDAKRDQREIAATICFNLAEFYEELKQTEKAIATYDQALRFNEAHEKSRLALAKLYLSLGKLDDCQAHCVSLMRIDPANKEGSMMLADVMFRKDDPDAATYHFQQLLEKNPTRYQALGKLIQLLRRAGRLVDAPRFIKLAEKSSAKASYAPGLYYCKGLLAWYTNDPREALNGFNQCRKDGEFGRDALINMIEIYLNPDNQDSFQESAEAKGDNSAHLEAADRLLAELKSIGDNSPKRQVLEAYSLMARHRQDPRNVDRAVEILLRICQSDKSYVPGLLALSNAFVLKGEPQKSKNQLKIIAKLPPNPDYAPEFERSWLMLADSYIAQGKMELASELCKKTLNSNKSSAKAWEHLGLILMKEETYRDAAEKYEQAWQYMNESSPSVGYKLALTYLKAKRYVEAIDICHKVLTQFPDYPNVRKHILDKARTALRP